MNIFYIIFHYNEIFLSPWNAVSTNFKALSSYHIVSKRMVTGIKMYIS